MTNKNPSMFSSSPFNSDEAFLDLTTPKMANDLCAEDNSDEAL